MSSEPEASVREIHPVEAETLVQQGGLHILDVRSPREYAELGHIPGALLLPVELIASAAATLPRDNKPLLVYCEHGVRSVHAARFLAQAGRTDILNLKGGMSCWTGARDHTPADPSDLLGPSPWVLQNSDMLPWGGKALDLACGQGRNALLLAAAGFSVHAVDSDQDKINQLQETGRRLGLPLTGERIDLESPDVDLGQELYDLVLVVHYLHRPLFPKLLGALKNSGVLVYETFTVDQAARGKPTNPDFLLQPGELARLASSLEIVKQREGDHEGRMVASIVALKPAAPQS